MMRFHRSQRKEDEIALPTYNVNINYETHQETEQAFELNKEGGLSLKIEAKEFSQKRKYGVKQNTITRRITKTEYD